MRTVNCYRMLVHLHFRNLSNDYLSGDMQTSVLLQIKYIHHTQEFKKGPVFLALPAIMSARVLEVVTKAVDHWRNLTNIRHALFRIPRHHSARNISLIQLTLARSSALSFLSHILKITIIFLDPWSPAWQLKCMQLEIITLSNMITGTCTLVFDEQVVNLVQSFPRCTNQSIISVPALYCPLCGTNVWGYNLHTKPRKISKCNFTN